MCRINNVPVTVAANGASGTVSLRTICRKPAGPRFFFIGGSGGWEQCRGPSHSQWETAAKFADVGWPSQAGHSAHQPRLHLRPRHAAVGEGFVDAGMEPGELVVIEPELL